jgi:hypothetical protein
LVASGACFSAFWQQLDHFGWVILVVFRFSRFVTAIKPRQLHGLLFRLSTGKQTRNRRKLFKSRIIFSNTSFFGLATLGWINDTFLGKLNLLIDKTLVHAKFAHHKIGGQSRFR